MGEHHVQHDDLEGTTPADRATAMTPSTSVGMGESSDMITLTEAFAKRFPAGSSWARQALAGIGVDFSEAVLVHDLCAGWFRLDDAAPLVDTLWVLTDDRLGIGQTNAGAGDPRWIPLTAVVAIDAIDDSPLPLLAVELHLAGGLVMCAGWPEPFAEGVVGLLMERSAAVAAEESDTMPRELADPAVSAAVVDPSSLEGLDPSEWVEGSVGNEPPTTGLPPAGRYTPEPTDAGVSFAPSGDADAVAISDGWVNPFDVMDPAIANADFNRSGFTAESHEPSLIAGFGERPAPVDPSASVEDRPTVSEQEPVPVDDPWFDEISFDEDSLDESRFDETRLDETRFDAQRIGDPSEAVLDDFFGELDDGPVTGTVPVAEPASVGAVVIELHADAPDAPWNHRAVQWPTSLSGVTYVGGHPDQTRKRKNGTIVFGSAGIRVAGSGLQSWDLDLPWTQVTKLRIEGTDEVMFTEGVRIEPSSSALIVELVDGAKVYFEVRMRRPGSLRSPLAPMLQLVADIRSYRATGHP